MNFAQDLFLKIKEVRSGERITTTILINNKTGITANTQEEIFKEIHSRENNDSEEITQERDILDMIDISSCRRVLESALAASGDVLSQDIGAKNGMLLKNDLEGGQDK